jgi:hypothetical protein
LLWRAPRPFFRTHDAAPGGVPSFVADSATGVEGSEPTCPYAKGLRLALRVDAILLVRPGVNSDPVTAAFDSPFLFQRSCQLVQRRRLLRSLPVACVVSLHRR